MPILQIEGPESFKEGFDLWVTDQGSSWCDFFDFHLNGRITKFENHKVSSQNPELAKILQATEIKVEKPHTKNIVLLPADHFLRCRWLLVLSSKEESKKWENLRQSLKSLKLNSFRYFGENPDFLKDLDDVTIEVIRGRHGYTQPSTQ